MKWKFMAAIALVSIGLLGCQRDSNDLSDIPYCGNMGDGFYSRRLTVHNTEVYYEFCVLTDSERRNFRNTTPFLEIANAVEVNPGTMFPPWLIISEQGRYLSGHFIYYADLQPAPDLRFDSALVDVELVLDRDTFTIDERRIPAILVNNSDAFIEFGMKIVVEHFDGNVWLTLPGVLVVPSLGLVLQPGEEMMKFGSLVPFETEVFSFVPGRYRLRLEIGIPTTHDVVAEFTLE